MNGNDGDCQSDIEGSIDCGELVKVGDPARGIRRGAEEGVASWLSSFAPCAVICSPLVEANLTHKPSQISSSYG